jgi:Leucine-rich repeat (LRR) protein
LKNKQFRLYQIVFSFSLFVIVLFPPTERFTAGNNNLGGALPASISQLGRLNTIWLYNNNFSGELFAIGSLANLVTLDVLGNSLTGSLSTAFAALPVLENLYLGQNQFSGPIPDEYGNFGRLQLLSLESNQLTGTINPVLSNLGLTLTSLRLGDNNFDADVFPTFVYGMTSLRDLRLNSCSLSGSIDEAIGNLVDLQVLAVEDNLLEGGIPAAVVDLIGLTRFTASNNVLTGPIPDAIGNLVSLTRLEFDANQLTGEMPASITNLESLGTYDRLRFQDAKYLSSQCTRYTHLYSI